MSPSTEPFNEAKYKALMDGVECSEVLISELDYSNRLDAEYYQKLHLQYKNKIENIKHNRLDYYADFLIGPFGSAYDTSNYVDYSEYRYVRGQDVKPFELQSTSARYMAKEDYERLIKYALNPGDILVSVVGTIGNACIVREKDVPGIFSCKSTVIRTHSINPYYLICYLNSKYGRSLLLRQERGAIQKGLNLDDLKIIPIPEFNEKLYQLFEKLLKVVDILQDNSNKEYESAECILLNEIGIDMSTIPSGGVSVKTFSESFGSTGRLDAEYYQPKYDKLIETIKLLAHKKLVEIVNISKSIEPGSDAYRDEGIPFVRISDISKYEILRTDKYLEPGSVYDNAEYYLKEDEILFSKDGSVGIAYKVESDAKMISSSALLHLSVKDKREVLPDYLTTVLNSKIVQLQAERDAGGSIIKHWKPGEIEEVIIPILPKEKQKEISKKAVKSFKLRRKSKDLLECAKSAVEMAIEKDEASAISLLEEKISELTGEVAHE